MQALQFQHAQPMSQLIHQPTPKPTGHDVLVAVEAVAVNPVDLKVKSTIDAELTGKILGWDAAGTIVEVGEKCHDFQAGDKVFYAGDVGRDGCFASHQLVDSRIIAKAPQSLEIHQSAALPLTSLTAWESLFDRLRINVEKDLGKTLLIIGAAGGVGSMAIQLAKQLTHLRVIATASRPETTEWCEILGADAVVSHQGSLTHNYQQANLPAPDYILCLNDSDYYYPQMVELIAPQGLIALVVSFQQPVDLNLLKTKSAGLVWEFMFTRPHLKTTDISQQGLILKRIAEMADLNQLYPVSLQHFDNLTPQTLEQAHDLVSHGKTIGKITLGPLSDA
ncbi:MULTISPECIES: zinc-binding alcohol dehydrogenase family protein [unclassified Methylophaga]|uniref:zinc-binding alcohol dehydrogenase family protein n=1 Tax=unclassified Methylophaga TaxID=2629249 RepID=UPI000C974074|nr:MULTISPECIES: zinc-binding alcohol dehydrogenase family protein [unclassified Methylophaga]MBN46411.1 NADPH:quinone reductase [Methylophaga sp.]|tara:strand:+ start:160659 stop:161663 length:1005 start_codon:yes stop_codon:yes gene_type:complete